MADLICKAVGRGSITELCEIRKQNNWIAIPIHLITQSNSDLNHNLKTSLELSVEKGRYDVAEFLVAELKYQIYPEWKKSMDRVWPFSWPSLNFDQVLPVLVVQSPEMEVIRDIFNQIPIINAIEYLIDSTMDEPYQWLEFVLNSIIRSSVSRTDMIVALEFIGAALVFKHINCVWRGLQCWEQAMALRYSSVGVHLPIIQVVPDLASSLFVLDGIKVIVSPTSLQRFKQEWTRYYRLQLAQAHALTVSQRILSQSGRRQAGPNSLHLENLLRYGNRCYDEQQYNYSFNISLLILKQTDDFNSNSSPNCIRIFVETVDLLSDCLKQQQLPGIQELTFPNLLVLVRFGLAILQNVMLLSPIARATTTDRWQFVIMKKLHQLILQHLQRCGSSQVEIQQLKECLSTYFRANNLNRFTSLLHRAIKGTDEIKKYPHVIVPLINLYLETGADPTAIDTNGKVPFQILAENSDWFQFDPESYKQVFQALLDAGCYHKQSISTGKTFLDILNDQKNKSVNNKFRFHHYLDPSINVVLPLSCACAKVIRQRQISFEDILHPPVLQSFVNRHSATKDYSNDSSLSMVN